MAVHLSRLELSNFRNYSSLDLPLQPGLTVLHGQNAQGKTNVVEAIQLLSSGSSYRALSDKEVIRWSAPESERLARVSGRVGDSELQVVVADMPGVSSKRVLLNGAGKRVADFVGHLTAAGNITAPHFFGGLIKTGFSFDKFVDGDLRQFAQGTPADVRARYDKIIDSNRKPPGPAYVALG